MAQDAFKPIDKKAKQTGGDGPYKYPIIGIVKDNIDPTRSGRIRVALQDGKGPVAPDDSGGWVTVQYLTTFFGVVRPNGGKDGEDYGSYVDNSSSYGQWQAPPDIGTKVLCIFVNGDPNAGFYIGSIPEPETLQMVPAIGASEVVTVNEGEAASYGGATRLPVTNLNTNNKDKANSDDFLNTPRPVHSYTASIMNQQGILRDPVRGPISSSASREASSRVGWGINTPGRPIYEGGFTDENLPQNLEQGKTEQLKVVARRGGHSIVMDDGDIIGRDQLVRIRSALGHQILMSDDGQTLMILHSNGQSYIELGKEGTVDIFSTNSINMRTQGDFNIHADRDVNIHAQENFNLQAKNIHTNSEEVTKSRAGKEYAITALNNFMVKASSAITMGAGGQASMVAGAEAFVNGSRVNLNSGSPAKAPEEVPIIPINAQADTLFDKEVGWAAAPAKLLSIASRAPAHYPWVNAGMGVDIKNSPAASDNLPEASSSAVQQVNKQAEATNAKPPAVATVASVPSTPSVSPTLDKGTTNAVLAANATSAAAGPTAEAVKSGAGIVKSSGSSLISGINSALNMVGEVANTANQVVGTANEDGVALGSFAQGAGQLMQSGILKPGSGALADGLASAGKTLNNTMPTALFTGLPGAESIERFVENTTAQAASLVSVMQTAQQQLTDAGVINGSESNTQTAGLIAAASTVGTDAVVGVVKEAAAITGAIENVAANTENAISDITGAVSSLSVQTPNIKTPTNLLTNVQQTAASLTSIATGAKDVLGAIGSGISAAKLSDGLGGLGGITNSLKALSGASTSLTGLLDSVKGISGSAFSAIKDSFGKLEAGKPQFLSDFAKKSAAATAITENSISAQASPAKKLSSLATGIGGAISDVSKLANDVNNTVNGITGAVNSLGGSVGSISKTLGGVTNAINGVASAAGDITGAVNSITNTVNTVTNSVTGATGALSNIAKLPSTINTGTINNSVVNAATQLTSAAGAITNAVDNITGIANNLGSSAKGVTSLINSTTGASLNNLTKSISGAVDTINSMAGAATSIKDGLSGLANAAKKAQAGGLAAKASQLSSGVSNLPGGIKAFSSVLDKANEVVNKIPGTDQLSGVMKDVQTAAKNGIGDVTSALNSVSSTIGKVEGALNTASSIVGSAGAVGSALGELSSIASKAGGLTSAITDKLPIGQATQLLSSVSALGAGGASPIKLPSLGLNTSDRSDITSQIKGVLGNPKIPEPNLLGDIKDDTISSLEEKIAGLEKEKESVSKEITAAVAERNAALDAAYTAEETLPAGDPKIQEAVDKFKAAAKKLNVLTKKYLDLMNETSAARDASLSGKISAINNASSPEEFLALTKKYS